MSKYVLLMNWTDQGVKAVKDSPTRLDAARASAKKAGCELQDFYMTIGPHDMVATVEAPDDATLAKWVLQVAAGGAVRSTTLKAFTETEYRSLIGGL